VRDSIFNKAVGKESIYMKLMNTVVSLPWLVCMIRTMVFYTRSSATVYAFAPPPNILSSITTPVYIRNSRIPSSDATAIVVSDRPIVLQKLSTSVGSTGRGISTSLGMGVTEAWDGYNTALELHPLIVKSITASIILGLGDFAGQAVQNLRSGTNKDVDFIRAARFALFGLVLQAPWNHFYYLLLDGQIPPTEEPLSSTNAIKVFIDQFIQAPIFTVLIFAFLGLLEGKGIEEIKQQLQNDYPETIVANCEWGDRMDNIVDVMLHQILAKLTRIFRRFILNNTGKLWVPATIINIGFVPPLFRVLYLNVIFFFWSIYLSLVLNKEETSA
jgi:peroxisomal membrane protein 2